MVVKGQEGRRLREQYPLLVTEAAARSACRLGPAVRLDAVYSRSCCGPPSAHKRRPLPGDAATRGPSDDGDDESFGACGGSIPGGASPLFSHPSATLSASIAQTSYRPAMRTAEPQQRCPEPAAPEVDAVNVRGNSPAVNADVSIVSLPATLCSPSTKLQPRRRSGDGLGCRRVSTADGADCDSAGAAGADGADGAAGAVGGGGRHSGAHSRNSCRAVSCAGAGVNDEADQAEWAQAGPVLRDCPGAEGCDKPTCIQLESHRAACPCSFGILEGTASAGPAKQASLPAPSGAASAPNSWRRCSLDAMADGACQPKSPQDAVQTQSSYCEANVPVLFAVRHRDGGNAEVRSGCGSLPAPSPSPSPPTLEEATDGQIWKQQQQQQEQQQRQWQPGTPPGDLDAVHNEGQRWFGPLGSSRLSKQPGLLPVTPLPVLLRLTGRAFSPQRSSMLGCNKSAMFRSTPMPITPAAVQEVSLVATAAKTDSTAVNGAPCSTRPFTEADSSTLGAALGASERDSTLLSRRAAGPTPTVRCAGDSGTASSGVCGTRSHSGVLRSSLAMLLSRVSHAHIHPDPQPRQPMASLRGASSNFQATHPSQHDASTLLRGHGILSVRVKLGRSTACRSRNPLRPGDAPAAATVATEVPQDGPCLQETVWGALVFTRLPRAQVAKEGRNLRRVLMARLEV